MKRVLINLIVLVVVALVAAHLVFGGGSVSKQAMAAYNAGDYAKALPLFKQWGETPEVRKDPGQQQLVMAYIHNIEQRMSGSGAGGEAGAAAAPADQSQIMQQAMSYALEQKKNLTDPTTGVDRVPHKPMAPGEMRTMTIKQLGNFDFEPTTDKEVPEDVMALSGGRVKLNGYMIPLTQANQVTDFALVPSLLGCCFGQPPGVQHVITVHMDVDKAVEYMIDELEVEGVLQVNVKQQDGYTYSIFELTGNSMKVKE